jgi:hypothetical protein
MATGRNFSKSGINSGHHYLPTYQILMISDNVEFCGIVVAILKMVEKFLPLSFTKWLPQYHTNSTLSDFNAISYVGRL